MNINEKETIEKQREYLVVKRNELIQQNRFELNISEQKTVAFICSMIKPVDPSGKDIPYQLEYEFNIRDYCKICGLHYDNGKNYLDVKNTLKKLSDKSMWLQDGSEEILVRWLSKVKTNKKSGKAIIELDRDLVPFLFNLGQRFTQYQLYNILAMKSEYSVRIYEIMKSYAFQKSKTFDLDELKKLLCVDNIKSYQEFAPFRQKVLDKAQEEINELTDINIFYEPISKGRKVIKVKFKIDMKNPMDRFISSTTANERLEYNN